MTTRDVTYLSAAAIGVLAFGFKFRYLRRQWGTPQLWAVIVTLFIATATWWCVSPVTIRMLNRATGITNFTAPLVYCLGTAFAGSTLTLAVFWRFPPKRAWPLAIAVIVVYVASITSIIILFSVSDVHVVRITDFETYYARQPTVAALLMVYVVPSGIGQGLITYGCLTWAQSKDLVDRPWLRRGLRLYGISAGLGVILYIQKFVTVVSNWFGQHWLDRVNVLLPVIFSLPSMLIALAAVVLPIWGPRLSLLRSWVRTWAAFWVLRPLHRAMRPVHPAAVLVTPGKRFDPHHRVRRQIVELEDFKFRLQHRFDPGVEDTARRGARQARLSDDELRAIVEAAQLKAAITRYLSESSPETQRPALHGTAPLQHSTDLGSDLARWVRVAKAFTAAPVVAAAITNPAGRDTLTVRGPGS